MFLMRMKKKFEKQDKKSLDEIFAIQRDRLSKNFKVYLPHLQKIFCNLDFLVRYPDLLDTLGWCDEHHTLTIGIVENGKIVNIKWRTKKNNPGKWISVFGGKQAFSLSVSVLLLIFACLRAKKML